MVIQLDNDSLEAKLVRLLLRDIPITLEEAARELKVSEDKLRRCIKGLVSRGILQVEGQPDMNYLRLIRRDFSFHGTNPSQEKTLKHRRSRTKKKNDEKRSADIMYG